MTNVFGEGIDYEIDTEEILNEVEAKLKMVNITNDQKFIDVNELNTFNLKFKSDITKGNEKIKKEIIDYKKEIDISLMDYTNKIIEMEKKFKSDITNVEKIKSDIFKKIKEFENRNYVIILVYGNKLAKQEKHIAELEKKVNLINKNINKWYEEVEKRFDEIAIEKINEKIRKIDEKEPKKKITFTEGHKKFKEKYGLSVKEIEVYKHWFENKKGCLLPLNFPNYFYKK